MNTAQSRDNCSTLVQCLCPTHSPTGWSSVLDIQLWQWHPSKVKLFIFVLRCIQFYAFPWMLNDLLFIDCLFVYLLFSLTCIQTASILLSFEQAFAGGPHSTDSLHLNTVFNLETVGYMGSAVRWCVFMCVWNGSATGQEWAGAAGFRLMMAVSIYLLLNISHPRRWMFVFFFTFICWGRQFVCLLYC